MHFYNILALFLIFSAFACVLSDDSSDVKRYDGDKVFRVFANDQARFDFVGLFTHAPCQQVNIWRAPNRPGQPFDIHVGSSWVKTFQGILNSTFISHRIIIDDVQLAIDKANRENKIIITRLRSSSGDSGDITGTFPELEQLKNWLTSMCASYSTIAECGSVGQSFEGRQIPYIKATVHAAEWLTTTTAVYIIKKLLTEYGNGEATVTKLVDVYDWIVVPVFNVDGYEFSQKSERFWRKNRHTFPGERCVGVDLNRNWDFFWGIESWTEICAERYVGTSAFSEPESSNLSKFLDDRKSALFAYFGLHSYGSGWLLPYGYGPKPSDYDEILRVGQIGAKVQIEVSNSTLYIDNLYDRLGDITGSSIDWVKLKLGTPYTFALELPPGSADNGFIAFPRDIEPTGRQVWAGLAAAVRAMKTY